MRFATAPTDGGRGGLADAGSYADLAAGIDRAQREAFDRGESAHTRKATMAEDVRPSAGDLLGSDGACPAVTVGTRTWKIGRPDQAAKARFEELVVAHAEANLTRVGGLLSPERRAAQEAWLYEQIAGRQYAAGGAMWEAVVAGPDANAVFLASLLQEHHPDATVADAGRLLAAAFGPVMRAMARVMPPFLSLMLADIPGLSAELTAARVEKAAAHYRAMAARSPAGPGSSPA